MTFGTHCFSNLDDLIDAVHALFSRWEQDAEAASLDPVYLDRTRLAVHEWLANLVQHADFGARRPEIVLRAAYAGGRLRCEVEDNSVGFDLDDQIAAREGVLSAFPERGMGLLMLRATTEDLRYEADGAERHRLTFSVTSEGDPLLDLPF